jgi:hypothetical protein
MVLKKENSMATIEELRLKILDRPQIVLDERVGSGDGEKTVFKLAHSPVMSGTANVRVGGDVQVASTDYELDCLTGKLTFDEGPKDGDAIVASYDFAAFSDSELQVYLDGAGGNLALAAGEALTSLVSDRARLVTWARGDMRIDYDRLRQDISDVAARYLSQGRSEVGGARTDDVGWEEVV